MKNRTYKETKAWQDYLITQRQFRYTALAAAGVLLTGAIFYHQVENLSWVDAFYFCTITLTTIGYGDIVPHTDTGKIFTIFYVLAGVSILASFANVFLKNAYQKRKAKTQGTERNT